MSEKMKFFKVVIFATDDHHFDRMTVEGQTRQAQILLPLDAVACLIPLEPNNPKTSYSVKFKKSYLADAPFPVKSISTVNLTWEQVELIK